jgi:hypothetical protein
MSEAASSSKIDDQSRTTSEKSSLSYKFKAGLFLATAGGFGLLFGFSGALTSAKKKDPSNFDKGLIGDIAPKEIKQRKLQETGARLAARALGIGTLYAIGGCGLLFYSLWKLSGAQDLADFRQKAGNILPRVPKNNPPQSRTEFSGINDFLQYVIDKDEEEKVLKNKSHDGDK